MTILAASNACIVVVNFGQIEFAFALFCVAYSTEHLGFVLKTTLASVGCGLCLDAL